MDKRRLLNLSFAVIWLDFPLLYYTSAVARDPLLATAALAIMAIAVATALFT